MAKIGSKRLKQWSKLKVLKTRNRLCLWGYLRNPLKRQKYAEMAWG
jgi:hypothetical protein